MALTWVSAGLKGEEAAGRKLPADSEKGMAREKIVLVWRGRGRLWL